MSYTPYTVSPAQALRQQSILTQVYAWMTAGLLVTGAVALFVVNSPALLVAIFGTRFVFFGLLIAEVAMVWSLGAALGRLSAGAATALFLAYAALNGLTLSVIFLVYTRGSIASTFFITGGTFGVLSLYGYTTRRDLTTVGNLCVMGLIGFLLASLVNLLLHSPALYWITTYAGLAIFVGLTAWDTQKLKRLSAQAGDETQARQVAIYGALVLYLDFINLFLLLLRVFGRRR